MPRTSTRSLIVILLVGIFLLALYDSDVLFMPKLLIFVFILGAAAVFNKLDDLVRNWFVFLAFVYLTDGLRGLIYYITCKLDLPVHVLYVLRGEQAIFGPTIPSVTIQRAVLTPGAAMGEFTGLQKFLTFIHGSHFVVFLLIGLVLWFRRSKFFRPYKASFYALFSLGLFAFLLVPTAPPWMASELFGLVPKLLHFNVALYNAAAPDLTTGFNTNPIAAMPSLHAAFPALCSLILWRLGRWKSLPFHLYTLLVFFMLVATGDHYTLDIAAGVLLAAAAYVIGFRIVKPGIPSATTRLSATAAPTGLIGLSETTGSTGSSGDPAAEAAQKTRAVALGCALFALGIGVGMFTRNGFRSAPEAYHYSAGPRFADIFAREAEFGDSYGAQFYFGSYRLVHGDTARALGYFEKALPLSRDFTERKSAEMRIKQCRALLGK
jgi:hypothetical protein